MKKLVLFLVVVVFLLVGVSAQSALSTTGPSFQGNQGNSFVSSNVQFATPGYGTPGRTVTDSSFFSLDPRSSFEVCQERQDFLIQIAPGGCSPNVVRSDLLAEQNVPVFCQLQAVMINPTIDVSTIKNIRLVPEGPIPKGILGINYQRPRSAYKANFNQRQGFATVDNLGYVVIALKGGMPEREMLDFINGTISARISYDAFNSFGFGLKDNYLPILSDDEWRDRYLEFGFFDGSGYIRLESLDGNKARVGIYADADRRIETIVVDKGKTSQENYLPGFYCNAAYSVSYLDSKKPEPKATILLDYDEYEVHVGDKLQDGLCTVLSVNPVGNGIGSVKIRCNGLGSTTLSLKHRPVNLKVGGEEGKNYAIGEVIGTVKETVKEVEKEVEVYFVGAGTYSVGDNKGNSFIVLSKKKDLKPVKDIIDKISSGKEFDNKYEVISSSGDAFGLNIVINSFESVSNVGGSSDFENYYTEAIRSYREMEELYDGNSIYNISRGDKSVYAGEVALNDAIELSKSVHKDKTRLELIEQLNSVEVYGKRSEDEVRVLDLKEADHVFSSDGFNHVISLVRVDDVDREKNKVKIGIDGKISPYYNNGELLVDKLRLAGFDQSGIRISGTCVVDEKSKPINEVLELGQRRDICGYNFEVVELNVESTAKIRLNPVNKNAGGITNFSYGVGIEKRAIELSPDKSLKRIEKLNKSIEKWENINDGLGKAVEGFKAACFATSAALQVKNLFSNVGGGAIARGIVMQEKWNEACADSNHNGVDYVSVDHCYSANNNEIEKDVKEINALIDQQQKDIKVNDDPFVGESQGIFGGKSFNYDEALENYKTNYVSGRFGENTVKDSDGKNEISVSEALEGVTDYETLRRIDFNLRARESNLDPELKAALEKDLYNDLSQAKKFAVDTEVTNDYSNKLSDQGIVWSAPKTQYYLTDDSEVARFAHSGIYTGGVIGQDEESNSYGLPKSTPVEPVKIDGKDYILQLEKEKGKSNQYSLVNIYADNSKDPLLKEGEGSEIYESILKQTKGEFIRFTSESYRNRYREPLVRYYEREPFKGKPAVVPFDINNGWYAGTKQSLPIFGSQGSFDDAGNVLSAWICNVGDNGREEFNSGLGDDICQQVNTFTGQTRDRFIGLSDSESSKIIGQGITALENAAAGYRPGVKEVLILGQKRKVGSPQASAPETQCQSFMSPKDCKLLFNVCDPVICPSSRCDLGGKFPVDNVAQTGIVGSVLMCLPNIKEGIVVPICLTGVHAGIDNYVSILKASRDCLTESVETGRYVGICDEITAIYQCEFFWNQVAPAVNILLPKLLEGFTGQSTRGGGEYLNVQSAWDNMQGSINYFKDSYAVNAFSAFNVRSTAEVGGEICKGFVSTRYPNKFKTLIEPDSPVQYSAWFDEIPGSTSVTPAISHYKVFYHIFAGNDVGTQYSVYLKTPEGSSFYQSTGNLIVDTGFIARGDYIDLTRDFTGPSGFRELCIRTNFEEKCGFKQVSTSFAINFVRDSYVKSQVEETNINSERECVSGTSVLEGGSALSLANPNLQSGVEDSLTPRIYERGIIRLCATGNPGIGNDQNRFAQVGNCGDPKVGCWLDMESVDRAITPGHDVDITIDSLNEAIEKQREREDEGKFDVHLSEINIIEGEIVDLKKNSKKFEDAEAEGLVIIAKIDRLMNKGLSFSQESQVALMHAKVNGILTEKAWAVVEDENVDGTPPSDGEEEGGGVVDENGDDENDVEDTPELIRDTNPRFDPNKIISLEIPSIILANDGEISEIVKQREQEHFDLVKRISEEQELNTNMIRAIIMQESKWDLNARGTGNDWGLMQVVWEGDAAFADVKERATNDVCASLEEYKTASRYQLFDPEINVYYGTCYLNILYYLNGITDFQLLIGAYNRGPDNINGPCGKGGVYENCKDKLDSAAMNYINGVMDYYWQYEKQTVQSYDSSVVVDRSQIQTA